MNGASPGVVFKLLVLAVVVVLGVLGFSGAFGRQPTAAEPQAEARTTTAPAAPAAPGDQTVELSEAELTAALNEQLVGQSLGATPLGPATLQRITARLTDGHMLADGDAVVGSATVPVAMTASMRVENGRPLVIVEDLRVAGVPMPASARGPAQEALQGQLDTQVQRLKLRVTSLTIADGKLRLVGARQ